MKSLPSWNCDLRGSSPSDGVRYREVLLYIEFLKRSTINETNYKIYKYLLEKIKHKSKKLYYSKLLLKFEDKIKKQTWNTMKEIIGKSKLQS